jgi:catechol 2,3-dioxygenase-like lactoylglutathione lyase family enzyme
MKPQGIDHIHFTVTDLEKAIEFYRALGLIVAERMDHEGESAQMAGEDGELVVDLRQAKNIDNPGYNHYAIKVEDIDSTCSELRDRGLVVDGPVYVRGNQAETRHNPGSQRNSRSTGGSQRLTDGLSKNKPGIYVVN